MDNEQYLKVKEMAAYLRCSNQHVYRLIHAGTLKAKRVGTHFRVTVSSADEYIRSISTNREEM